MSGNLIQYAFVAGELAPDLKGRTDFEKYDLGLALARNWFIEYRGGIATRPGLEFLEFVQEDDKDARLIPFSFSPDIANTNALLFGDGYIRFLQDGAYTLEADKTIINVTQANPGVVTITGHGFSNGDWLKLSGIVGMTELNGRTVEVSASTTNTFELLDQFGAALNTTDLTAYVSGGIANRIYTIVSPYATTDLARLKVHQIRDTLRITHPDYKTRNLVRSGALSWALSLETIANGMTAPSGLAHTAQVAGTSGAVFAVTAIDEDGNESLISDPHFVADSNNYTTTAGSLTLTWSKVTDARKYNVYRSLILDVATDLTAGMQLGFIGDTFGLQFTDNNIIADFTRTPPNGYDPFADGAIIDIDITAQGSLYAKSDTVSVSGGGGSGFRGVPIVNDAGNIIEVLILNGGSGYSAPTVSFGTSTGSGATATAEAGPSTGNNPSENITFQQRQLYTATTNNPLQILGSKVGLLSNFDTSDFPVDSDSFDFTVDSRSITPIRHLKAMKGGLLVFSHEAVWLLRGISDEVITPNNALADPQTFVGASTVEPLNIDRDIIYVTAKDSTVRLLILNDFSKLYNAQDISILSSHFFDSEAPLCCWCYAHAPHKVVYAVRDDGVMLALTIVREQDVTGWTWFTTQGRFKDVLCLEEDGIDRVYTIVERRIDGALHKFVERFAERNFKYAEDAWCVDSGLSLTPTYPAGTLEIDAASGSDVIFSVWDATPFTSSDVGKIIRAGGCLAEIISYVNQNRVRCLIHADRPVTDVDYETELPWPIPTGKWTMDAAVTEIGGLWHLEGQTVSILGDGNVFPQQVVSAGKITLTDGVTRLVVGLPFRCVAQTLPPTAQEGVIEGSRKHIIGMAARLSDTRGLKVGTNLNDLKEVRERTTEPWGSPTRLKNNVQYSIIPHRWDTEAQYYLVQDDPLPAKILGLVTELEVGDDTR